MSFITDAVCIGGILAGVWVTGILGLQKSEKDAYTTAYRSALVRHADTNKNGIVSTEEQVAFQ